MSLQFGFFYSNSICYPAFRKLERRLLPLVARRRSAPRPERRLTLLISTRVCAIRVDRLYLLLPSNVFFLLAVLKQVHPDTGISNRAMSILNSFVNGMFFPRSRFAIKYFSPFGFTDSNLLFFQTFSSVLRLRPPSSLLITRSQPSLLARSRLRSVLSSPVNSPSTLSLRAPRPSPSTLLPRNKWILESTSKKTRGNNGFVLGFLIWSLVINNPVGIIFVLGV